MCWNQISLKKKNKSTGYSSILTDSQPVQYSCYKLISTLRPGLGSTQPVLKMGMFRVQNHVLVLNPVLLHYYFQPWTHEKRFWFDVLTKLDVLQYLDMLHKVLNCWLPALGHILCSTTSETSHANCHCGPLS